MILSRRLLTIGAAFLTLVLALLVCTPVQSQPDDDSNPGAPAMRSLLKKYCYSCHASKNAEGKLRLDKLPFNFGDAAVNKKWTDVRNRIRSGEMPPSKEKSRPGNAEARVMVEWLTENLR